MLSICVRGRLGKGVECPIIQSSACEVFSLVGDLGKFGEGDYVMLCGTIAEFSFCMQGRTISVSWIGPDEGGAQCLEAALTGEFRTVYSVQSVALTLEKILPPNLVVTATGEVTSTGWSDARLDPVVYIQPPPDGIYDMTFVAKAPTGITQPVISPVDGFGRYEPMPEDLRGVRVHAVTNSVLRMRSR